VCPISRNILVPYGMSRGLVQTRPLRQTESTPQLGHADAISSAVTTCTTRPPNASDATRSTARHAQVEQTRGIRHEILLNTGNSRTLRQTRGLTLIMNTVLTTAMITRSRASYVSALDPSCPVKSEEPV
jgi:hypothetical protein